MISPAQNLANRRNALKSTGPKTNSGKIKASQNAVKHGLNKPINKKDVSDQLDRLSVILEAAGYQPRHAHRISLCLLDYDRVMRAQDELSFRLESLASAGHYLKSQSDDTHHVADQEISDDEAETALLAWFSRAFGLDRVPPKPGALCGQNLWMRVTSDRQYERYRKRSLNQLLKALRAQNDDYK